MVTAILPTMTLSSPLADPRTPSRHPNNTSHTMTPSISSELTITPARFMSRSPTTPSSRNQNTGASTSQLAGLVGIFTGLGALLALGIFLPLPTHFQNSGASPPAAIAASFYVVGAIAILVSFACFLGLRGLPGEEEKGFQRLLSTSSHKSPESTPSDRPILSYPRLLLTSIVLGFKSQNIGLGYLGGFVARASSVAISLFIPLFTNAYFLRTGLCSPADPADPSDIKHACPRAYLLAAALTGTSQLVALLSAPLFGYLSGRYKRFNVPLLIAALAGIAGYTAFGALRSPDPKSDDGSAVIFAIVALLGLSQIGCIVCSLALLGRGIQNDEGNGEDGDAVIAYPDLNGDPNAPHVSSAGATPLPSPPVLQHEETEPLLPAHAPSHIRYLPPSSRSHTHLKGSIAGTYSLAGGAGILLLTKAGGALFDSWGPGSPFYMMAGFNLVLLFVGVGVGAREALRGRGREAERMGFGES